jgi:hypothetical protein
MKTNHKIANTILLIAFLVPTLIFCLLHSTPKMALRTFMLFDGHPMIALTSSIETQYDQFQKYYSFIKMDTKPEFTASGSDYIPFFSVKKKAFLYFAEHYNPGV